MACETTARRVSRRRDRVPGSSRHPTREFGKAVPAPTDGAQLEHIPRLRRWKEALGRSWPSSNREVVHGLRPAWNNAPLARLRAILRAAYPGDRYVGSRPRLGPSPRAKLRGQPLARRKTDFCRGRGSLALRPHHPLLSSTNRLMRLAPPASAAARRMGAMPWPDCDKGKRAPNPAPAWPTRERGAPWRRRRR